MFQEVWPAVKMVCGVVCSDLGCFILGTCSNDKGIGHLHESYIGGSPCKPCCNKQYIMKHLLQVISNASACHVYVISRKLKFTPKFLSGVTINRVI